MFKGLIFGIAFGLLFAITFLFAFKAAGMMTEWLDNLPPLYEWFFSVNEVEPQEPVHNIVKGNNA
jgi:hypothetical protein